MKYETPRKKVWENPDDSGFGKEFLDITRKTQSMKKTSST